MGMAKYFAVLSHMCCHCSILAIPYRGLGLEHATLIIHRSASSSAPNRPSRASSTQHR